MTADGALLGRTAIRKDSNGKESGRNWTQQKELQKISKHRRDLDRKFLWETRWGGKQEAVHWVLAFQFKVMKGSEAWWPQLDHSTDIFDAGGLSLNWPKR